eukprot:superscaffoldBa00009008_g23794
MDDCLTRGDSSQLVSLLHYEGLTSTTLTTLDQLVTKELSGSGFSRVLVVLRSLEILSENRDDLQTLTNHGLITKVIIDLLIRRLLADLCESLDTDVVCLFFEVLSWFEAVRDLLTSDLQKSSAPPLSLTEGFYDYFLLALSALEPKVVFALRLEVSLSEALCRLTPRKDRQQRANQWFSSPDISNAFCDIRDGDFEVDCRRFLNFVNSCHGDDRRVYTFPCRRAFLDSTELFRPKDDKLDEFWIDFNLDSRCVSFFIDEPQGFLWGSVHLLREEVDHYRVQLKDNECSGADTVLSVRLNNPIMHLNSRGQTVKLTFDPEHHRQLQEAAGRVFMVSSSPRVTDSGGTVQVSPSAARSSGASYSRKKPQSKSQLK